MSGVWVYSEMRDGRPGAVALELISKATEFGGATAVLLGRDAASRGEGRRGVWRDARDHRPEPGLRRAPGAAGGRDAGGPRGRAQAVAGPLRDDLRQPRCRLAPRRAPRCRRGRNVTGIEQAGDGFRVADAVGHEYGRGGRVAERGDEAGAGPPEGVHGGGESAGLARWRRSAGRSARRRWRFASPTPSRRRRRGRRCPTRRWSSRAGAAWSARTISC